MKKSLFLVILIGTLSLSACTSIGGDFKYKQVDASVNSSRLVHKVCVPEHSLSNKEYYHSDMQDLNFYHSHEYTANREKLLCRYGVYETNVRFNNPMNNRAVRGTILTKERYQRDDVIPVYHRYRM